MLVAGTNVQYESTATARNEVTAAMKLTVAGVRKAVRTLKRANAKPLAGGYYVAIVHPDTTYDLQGDSAWVATSNYAGGEQIFSGEIGRIYGVRFVESTLAKKFAAAGAGVTGSEADVYATLVIGQNAYGIVPLEGGNLEFIFKPAGSAGTADPLSQVWTSAWKAAFTAKILDNTAMVRIEHGATA